MSVPHTALAIALMGLFSVALLLLQHRREEIPMPGARLWIAGAGISSLGVALGSLHRQLPVELSILANNTLLTYGLALWWGSLRMLVNQAPRHGVCLALASVALINACVFTCALPSHSGRLMVGSALMASVSLAAFVQLNAVRKAFPLTGVRPLMFCLMGFSVSFYFRSVLMWFEPATDYGMSTQPINMVIVAWGGLMLFGSSISFALMQHRYSVEHPYPR